MEAGQESLPWIPILTNPVNAGVVGLHPTLLVIFQCSVSLVLQIIFPFCRNELDTTYKVGTLFLQSAAAESWAGGLVQIGRKKQRRLPTTDRRTAPPFTLQRIMRDCQVPRALNRTGTGILVEQKILT